MTCWGCGTAVETHATKLCQPCRSKLVPLDRYVWHRTCRCGKGLNPRLLRTGRVVTGRENNRKVAADEYHLVPQRCPGCKES